MSSSTKSTSPHVLITGSTSGIGWGLARGFAAKGYNVTLNGLAEPAQVEKLLGELRAEFGVQAWYSPANMMRAAEIRDMVLEAEKRGGLDVLVNNAGIQHVSPVEDFPDEKWDAITAINLSSVFHATKAAIPGMKARGFGRVINVLNTSAKAPAAGRAPTDRQRQVLTLIAQGHSNKAIARTLGVSPATVKTHVANAIASVGAANRAEAAIRARDLKLI